MPSRLNGILTYFSSFPYNRRSNRFEDGAKFTFRPWYIPRARNVNMAMPEDKRNGSGTFASHEAYTSEEHILYRFRNKLCRAFMTTVRLDIAGRSGFFAGSYFCP